MVPGARGTAGLWSVGPTPRFVKVLVSRQPAVAVGSSRRARASAARAGGTRPSLRAAAAATSAVCRIRVRIDASCVRAADLGRTTRWSTVAAARVVCTAFTDPTRTSRAAVAHAGPVAKTAIAALSRARAAAIARHARQPGRSAVVGARSAVPIGGVRNATAAALQRSDAAHECSARARAAGARGVGAARARRAARSPELVLVEIVRAPRAERERGDQRSNSGRGPHQNRPSRVTEPAPARTPTPVPAPFRSADCQSNTAPVPSANNPTNRAALAAV